MENVDCYMSCKAFSFWSILGSLTCEKCHEHFIT